MQEFIELTQSLKQKAASDLSIHNIGYEACPPGYHYGPRICPYYLIHFVTKGCGMLFIQNLELPVKTGEAFLIPADKIASYKSDDKTPWSYAWTGFLGTKADPFFRQLTISSPEKYVLHDLDTEKYAALIRKAAIRKETGKINYFYANSILLQIFSELSGDVMGKESRVQKSLLADEIRYYLEMKYSEHLVITEVAAELGIHPNYLTAAFRERFGMTPKQFLTERKINKACQLLSDTELPVGMIAQTLGFDDQMAFSKVFKKHMELSPSAFRQEQRSRPNIQIPETEKDFVTYTD